MVYSAMYIGEPTQQCKWESQEVEKLPPYQLNYAANPIIKQGVFQPLLACGTPTYGMVTFGTLLHITALYCTILYHTALYCTVLLGTIRRRQRCSPDSPGYSTV